jgi:hypothetical protein
MKNFRVGNIVRVKMLQNVYYGRHREQEGIISIGTIGKITEYDRLDRIEVIFYVKKVDFNRNKWKDFRENKEFLFKGEVSMSSFPNIFKIIHYFHKRELIRANEKEVKWFKEMEENYESIELAKKL